MNGTVGAKLGSSEFQSKLLQTEVRPPGSPSTHGAQSHQRVRAQSLPCHSCLWVPGCPASCPCMCGQTLRRTTQPGTQVPLVLSI